MSKYSAPALEKGLDIIEYLSHKAIPQTQTEIATGVSKSPNEIYRMLAVLENRGYLIRSASGKYSISLKLYHISHRHSPVDGLLKVAKPIMEELSNKTKQSCHMGILYNRKLMIISQTKSPGPVTLSIEEGSLFPLIKTTSGRVILAFLDETQRDKILKKDTDYIALNNADKHEFLKRLNTIKKLGYELKNSEITMGVTDVGVPVGKTVNGVFSVLTVSSLTSVHQENEAGEFLIESVKEAALAIDKAMKL